MSKISNLMTHLVANYPDPATFQQALEAMLESSVEYLEIQLPFTNPVADGFKIFTANQIALKHNCSLDSILEIINKTYNPAIHTTKLILMTYLTPIYVLGFESVVNKLKNQSFAGIIVPDLIEGSREFDQLNNLCADNKLEFVSVISPITTSERLRQIKSKLQINQLVYATARAGKTGPKTDFSQLQPYLDTLKNNLAEYKIAVGFGISERSQVDFLNQQGFVAVIGSEIVSQIQLAKEQNNTTKNQITTYLKSISND